MATNINAVRIANNGGSIPVDTIVLNNAKEGAPPIFQKAVVEEVIFNPKDLTEDDKNRIRSLVSNPNALDQIAANSVIGVLINDGISQAIPTRVILFPYFQSHLMLPVQAGEQVSVVFEDFQKYNFLAGKWITRISEGLPTEDLNFTHGDRRYNKINFSGERTSSSFSRVSSSYTPEFPNGSDQKNTYSLPQIDAVNPFDVIKQTANASLMHSYEVVPRWTKRPQEFVIQGMNNSLIMLGQDRVGEVSGAASQQSDQKKYAGSIDIVAGRSRYLLDPSDNNIPTEFINQKKTSPFVVTNSRGLMEVDKTPRLNARIEQTKEGDPDFSHDAARIYLSMKTVGDKNFKISHTTEGNAANAMQSTGINYSNQSLQPAQPISSSENIGSSYIINKADHIRLIARRSIPTEQPLISGSLLLLKEGNNRTPEDPNAQSANNDHLAYFYMTPEGRIQIDGMQIFLGGAAINSNPAPQNPQMPEPDMPSNVEGSLDSDPNVGNTNNFAGIEPYIKWSEFRNVVEGLQLQIQDLYNAYDALVNDIRDATAGSVCTPYGPDSAWANLFSKCAQQRRNCRTNLNSNITNTNKAVYRSRSSKIFGQ
jgi:hypothetical protein